jgi:hypothetical protein
MCLTNTTHGPNRCAQHADQMNLAENFLSVTLFVSNAGDFIFWLPAFELISTMLDEMGHLLQRSLEMAQH